MNDTDRQAKAYMGRYPQLNAGRSKSEPSAMGVIVCAVMDDA